MADPRATQPPTLQHPATRPSPETSQTSSTPSTAPSATTATTTTTTTTAVERGRPIAGLSLTQVAGGALAAVTSAVAASFLGVAGTLIGAAVGSVVSTLAATIYANSLSRAARVSKTLAVRRVLAPAHPGEAVRPEQHEQHEQQVGDGGRSVWAAVHWKPLALVAGIVFVAAMAVVSVSELALGHPLSNSRESGTTVGNLGGGSPASTPSTPANSPTSTPSVTSTAPATGATPTPTGSASVGGTATPSTGTSTTGPAASTPATSPPAPTTGAGGGGTTSSSAPAPSGG